MGREVLGMEGLPGRWSWTIGFSPYKREMGWDDNNVEAQLSGVWVVGIV